MTIKRGIFITKMIQFEIQRLEYHVSPLIMESSFLRIQHLLEGYEFEELEIFEDTDDKNQRDLVKGLRSEMFNLVPHSPFAEISFTRIQLVLEGKKRFL